MFFRTLLCHLSQTCMCEKPTSGLLNFMLISSLRSDKIYQCKKYYNGHALLCCFSQTWMFNKPTHGLLNKTSCLAPAFVVMIILSLFVELLKLEMNVQQQTHHDSKIVSWSKWRGMIFTPRQTHLWFVEQNLMLSSSFCLYESILFCNTLLCYLSQTLMFRNKPTTIQKVVSWSKWEGMFFTPRQTHIWSCLAPALVVMKVYNFCHILLCYLSQTLTFSNKPTTAQK
jgi:hypothetical protein